MEKVTMPIERIHYLFLNAESIKNSPQDVKLKTEIKLFKKVAFEDYDRTIYLGFLFNLDKETFDEWVSIIISNFFPDIISYQIL